VNPNWHNGLQDLSTQPNEPPCHPVLSANHGKDVRVSALPIEATRRFQSNSTIPAATETFNDEILPPWGWQDRVATLSNHFMESLPSPPIPSAAGDP